MASLRPSHIQSTWSWALVGAVLGAVLAVLVHLPAQWLAKAVSQATHQQVQIQEAQGSAWRGSGKLVLTGGQGSRDALALPGRIHWHTALAFHARPFSRANSCGSFISLAIWERTLNTFVSIQNTQVVTPVAAAAVDSVIKTWSKSHLRSLGRQKRRFR